MGVSKTSAGHRSKTSTSHQAKKTSTTKSLIQPKLSATGHRKHSWTKEQLSDANFLKVPASVWKNIHGSTRTEWIDAAEDTLTSAPAASALTPIPIVGLVGLVRVHKWFWDKSIEPKFRNDTYRYRVIEQATNTTILPEDVRYDPMDDETKIKILYVGLPLKGHLILLLRRICPDASMSPIKTTDQWRQFLAPSIRQGYSQIKRSTIYGWPPTVNPQKRQPEKESQHQALENSFGSIAPVSGVLGHW